jgi:hypothetical protein
MTKKGYKKLLANHHTGKIKPHKHTSYGSLVLVMFLTFMPLLFASHSVAVAADSYQTYAVVPGPAPNQAPVITNLSAGKVFTVNDPVPVRGSCPSGTLVKVFKNEVLAGAALCQNGSFQLSIDLFVGNNSLVARAYNMNDSVSPDSTPINVQLVLPGSRLTGTDQLNVQGAPAGQFYLTSEIFHRGVNAGDTLTWPLILAGGQAPYAVSVSWGDGKTDLISRGDAGRFDSNHVYSQPGGYRGSYTIIIKATDQAGNKSYLQLVAIVSGDKQPAGLAGSVTGGYGASTAIRLAWQLLAGGSIAVFSFWLGEKREERLLKRSAKGTV